jgi:hypothetical protein
MQALRFASKVVDHLLGKTMDSFRNHLSSKTSYRFTMYVVGLLDK